MNGTGSMSFRRKKNRDLTTHLKSFVSKLILLLLFTATTGIDALCQPAKRPEDFGFRLLRLPYKGDTVNILVKSARNEEQKPKPLLFFCQGSLPVPLILYNGEKGFGTFPFNPDSLLQDFHIAIAGKPSVPVVGYTALLQNDFAYRDSSGNFPPGYTSKNNLPYYTARNLEVISYLQKQPWISREKLVVAGHSEGSMIAVKMAFESKKVTHLIYSGGNPLGRMLTVITRDRLYETDSLPFAENDFRRWEAIIKDPGNKDATQGDSFETTYGFSTPAVPYFEKLTIPALISYGTKDAGSAPFVDYLRMEMIRQKKKNYTFKAYIGLEHNYFGLKKNGETDYEQFNWDAVASDWLYWLRKTK